MNILIIVILTIATTTFCYDVELEQAKILADQSEWSNQLNAYIDEAILNNLDSNTILANVRNLNQNYIKRPTATCAKHGCIDIDADILVNNTGIVERKKIKDIKKGDFVETNNGFDQVYFVYEHDYKLNLIDLITEKNSIAVTPNHIVSIFRNNSFINIVANDVIVGDMLYTFVEKSNNFEINEVIDISKKYSLTKYILTFNDYLVVNDILISCHVDFHQGGYYMTYPLRWIYQVCNNCVDQDTYFIQVSKFIYQLIFH